MKPIVHWRPRPRHGWIIRSALIVLLVVLAWWEGRVGSLWTNILPLLAVPVVLERFGQHDVWVLSHGVLAVQRWGAPTQLIPLATATFTQRGRSWRVRWQDGRVSRSLSLPYDGGFAPLLEQALRDNREVGDQVAPRTSREAARILSISLPDWGRAGSNAWLMLTLLVAGVPAVMGAAVWWDAPLLLLPLAALPYLFERLRVDYRLILTPVGLWFARMGEEPVAAPLEKVRTARDGWLLTYVWAEEPGFPGTWLIESANADLLRHLRKAQEVGAPAVTGGEPAGRVSESEPSRGCLRCSLCGRPIATPAGQDGGAATGERHVHICDRCANRTRYEAQEGGHGLTGKEPRPMG